MSRGARDVRVRLDFVVRFKNELISLPSELNDSIFFDAVLQALSKVPGAETVLGGMRTSINLDFRPKTRTKKTPDEYLDDGE